MHGGEVESLSGALGGQETERENASPDCLDGRRRRGEAEDGRSVLELVGKGLIEDELGNGFGLGGIDVRCLVEAELDLRGARAGVSGGDR